jgi:hypothetical protein
MYAKKTVLEVAPVFLFCFTARFAQDAKNAEEKYYFFSAERAEKK